MDTVDKATQSQLQNIQSRSGKTLAELFEIIRSSKLNGHGEIRGMLKNSLGMGYGDANALAAAYLKSIQNLSGEGALPTDADPASEIYAGSKSSPPPAA